MQAGTDSTDTEYTFPCGPIRVGSSVIGWGLRQQSPWGCEKIDVRHPAWKQSDLRSSYFAEKALPKEPSEIKVAQADAIQNRVLISRAKDLTLVSAYNLDGNLAIDVLVGAVKIQAANNPALVVAAGSRYIYFGDGKPGTISNDIKPTEIAKRQPVQIFLEPTNWSQNVTPLIEKFRRALKLTARVAIECRGEQVLSAEVSCFGDELELEEATLAQLINQYRVQNGLPAIPVSKALTLVANRHVRDMAENIRGLTHSWSNCQSSWSCMWEAPQRLKTAYPGMGYENAYGGSNEANAEAALKSWKQDPPHNNVIVNRDIWKGKQWKALGVGIYKGYAVMWVGEESDPV